MKPNILWIFTDQHRGQAMSCAGDPNIETPHLDHMAAEGVRFSRAYSNTPICTPARATLYTGQYITSHGALANHYPLLPGRAPQMAEVMAKAGYRTCHYGKWHLSGGTANQHYVSPYFRPGWQEWIGWECMHSRGDTGTYFDSAYCEGTGNEIGVHRIDKFQPDWLADRTIEWLGRQSAEVPWFHVVSIETPHAPCDFPANVPREYYRLFEKKELALRPNFANERREELDGFMRGYYSHVKNIDDNVGRILGALEQTGQLENTIVFYFSDHGDFMGSHGRGGKGRPEEEASSIPLIVRLPRSDRGSHSSDALIGLVDLMPTTLGLCGVPVPHTCEGVDLSGLIRGKTEVGPDELYLQYENSFFNQTRPEGYWRAIRRGDWMYCENLAQGPFQLFDLARDPYEMSNLVRDPELESTRCELHDRMVRKANALGDGFFGRSPAARGNLAHV